MTSHRRPHTPAGVIGRPHGRAAVPVPGPKDA